MPALLLLLACLRPPPAGTSTGEDPTAGPVPVPHTTPAPTSATGSLALDVVGFNVESGGADPQVVADEVVASVAGEAAWGFCEVEDDAAARILVAAAADAGGPAFDYVLGSTGWEDRLVLAWDPDRLALEDSEELDDINVGGTARAPLVGTMRDLASGIRFLLVVNHLWRSDADARHEQAELLNAWAADQALPLVLVGDYNFDWDVSSGGADRDAGFDLLTAGGVLEWVPIDPIEPTECSTVYDSILDFTFLGGDARGWDAAAATVPVADDYCRVNTDARSDHKPVRASLHASG